MRIVLAALLGLLLVLPICQSTYSKSDKKKKDNNNDKKEKPVADDRKAPANKAQPKPSNEKKSTEATKKSTTTIDQILADHTNAIYGEPRHLKGITLGYVTPWNSRGYDIAKWHAQKFTHISPVWFQILPHVEHHQLQSCDITGTHDMDQGWIESVRSNNSEIAIVPRFLFDKWSREDLIQLYQSGALQENCMRKVMDFIQRNRFEGAVLELWQQMVHHTKGEEIRMLLDMVVNFGELFRDRELITILPVPPPLDENNKENPVFTADIFAYLVPYIDYINIMTYDFPSRKITGIAPYEWVVKCVDWLASSHPEAVTRILVGINFYGYEKTKGEMQAKLGRDFIEMLQEKGAWQLQWDSKIREHFIRGTGSQQQRVVFYPTLASLQDRLEITTSKKMAGIGIWEIGQGLDHFMRLL